MRWNWRLEVKLKWIRIQIGNPTLVSPLSGPLRLSLTIEAAAESFCFVLLVPLFLLSKLSRAAQSLLLFAFLNWGLTLTLVFLLEIHSHSCLSSCLAAAILCQLRCLSQLRCQMASLFSPPIAHMWPFTCKLSDKVCSILGAYSEQRDIWYIYWPCKTYQLIIVFRYDSLSSRVPQQKTFSKKGQRGEHCNALWYCQAPWLMCHESSYCRISPIWTF